MRKTSYLILALLFSFSSIALAKTVHIKGGVTKTGVYRPPHFKTSPNKTKIDNWSTKGNTNPFTGKKGSVDPYKIRIKK